MKNVHKLTSFEINIYSYQYHLFYHSSKSYWDKNTEVIGRFRAVHSISCIIWMHFSSMTMLLNHFLTVWGELRNFSWTGAWRFPKYTNAMIKRTGHVCPNPILVFLMGPWLLNFDLINYNYMTMIMSYIQSEQKCKWILSCFKLVIA